MTSATVPRMVFCRSQIYSKTIYHDGRDWVIEKWGEGYWSFRLDGEEWTQGLPPGLAIEDVSLMFP